MRPLPPTACATRPEKETGQKNESGRKGSKIKPRIVRNYCARPETANLAPWMVAAEDGRAKREQTSRGFLSAIRMSPQKTTDKHVASHQWIPKASRQQAAPGDQCGGPSAAYIRLQGNVENPDEAGEGNPARPNPQEEREFVEVWDVMRAKEPRHPTPQKQKLPDEKPHGDRPGPGAGSFGPASRQPPAVKATKRVKIT